MDQLQLTTLPKRLSRDEMNLAEFPLTVLSKRTHPNLKTLQFSDSVKDRNGKPILRSWIITAADKFGLPTSSDDEVLLGLLKLTVNNEFRDRKVFFTRYELLQQLRWTTEGRSYRRLQSALDRLSGVRIKATNAFYDNESKAHSTRNFGIIDAYELNDGRDANPKPSFFSWSEVIFKSFQVGFIKKFDLDFYLNLKSAVSKRLFRYLDKHFWYRPSIDINLFMLCHEKIGVSRNYRFASSLRQQLDPAAEELVSLGFLSAFSYRGKGAETYVTFYAASRKPRVSSGDARVKLEIKTGDDAADLRGRVGELLLERGIKQHQLEKLIGEHSPEMLERINRIVEYFDSLVRGRSHLISRSPVGFLFRAAQNPLAFTLPGDGQGMQTRMQFGDSSRMTGLKEQGHGSGATKNSVEGEYLIARHRELEKIKESVEPHVLHKIVSDVRHELRNIKGSISESRFDESVNHGVGEKLLRLYAFPDFAEWAKRR